jgi:hypothetical protein
MLCSVGVLILGVLNAVVAVLTDSGSFECCVVSVNLHDVEKQTKIRARLVLTLTTTNVTLGTFYLPSKLILFVSMKTDTNH